jgi:hypothetical protein
MLVLATMLTPLHGAIVSAAAIPGAGVAGAQINADLPAASLTRLATPGVEIGVDQLSDADFLVGDLNNDNLPEVVTGWFYLQVMGNSGDPFSSNWITTRWAYADNVMPKALADMTVTAITTSSAPERTSPYTIGLWSNDGTPFDGTWSGS